MGITRYGINIQCRASAISSDHEIDGLEIHPQSHETGGDQMDDDVFNMQVRKFLKKVGINAQRAIETAVRDAIAEGKLTGNETLKASMQLEIADLDLSMTIDDDIALS
jgi:molecular chaperone DnaK (HSP70)